MIVKEQRHRIGVLIRTLLELSVNQQAEMLGVAPNTIYGYEAGKFNSSNIEAWYSFYYEKLNIEKILINVGCFKAFTKWEEYLDQKGDK